MGRRKLKFRAWDETYKTYVTWEEMSKTRMLGVFVNNNNRDNSNCILQQFTGLMDKNGKEVYEGDVVQACFVWGCIGGVVTYFDWLAAFGVEVNNGRYLFSEHSPNIWEVLGNVYENPGLLEAEDED